MACAFRLPVPGLDVARRDGPNPQGDSVDPVWSGWRTADDDQREWIRHHGEEEEGVLRVCRDRLAAFSSVHRRQLISLCAGSCREGGGAAGYPEQPFVAAVLGTRVVLTAVCRMELGCSWMGNKILPCLESAKNLGLSSKIHLLWSV